MTGATIAIRSKRNERVPGEVLACQVGSQGEANWPSRTDTRMPLTVRDTEIKQAPPQKGEQAGPRDAGVEATEQRIVSRPTRV